MSALIRTALLPLAVFALSLPVLADDAPAPEHSGADAPAAAAAEEPSGEHAEDEAHDDHAHDTGVPVSLAKDLALWSLVTFVCFLFVLKKAAWQPLIEGLDKREAGIRSAIVEAEENQRKSQALLADYEAKLRDAEQTVAEMIAEAKRDAERTSQDIVAKAEADVEAMRQRATEDIGRAKDAALSEVFQSVNSRIALATEHVLGRAISGEDQDRLVEEALAEIGA